MFPYLAKKVESEYDRQIARVLRDMQTVEPGSDQYDKLVNRLEKLQKMRADDRPESLNPNTVLLAATNLIGIGIIVRHEHLNVITTKALMFLRGPK